MTNNEQKIADLSELNLPLAEENRILKEIIKSLLSELSELKAKLNKNSGNSGKPPSSDGLRKPLVKNSRVSSGKPSGGQTGHTGHTKPLTPAPDKIIEIKPISSCDCGGEVIVQTEQYTVRQVTDVPRIKIITLEYRAYDGVCEKCGKVHKASVPEGIKNTPASYGANLKALVTYASAYHLIPLKRLTELISDMFGIHISQGLIVDSSQEAYEKLETAEAATKEEITGSEVAHFDETGMRVEGKTHWLHSASTETSTVYSIHEKRGIDAMDDMCILPRFEGTAIHDHWKSYYHYLCSHGECNEHHLRHLKYLYEELSQWWACEMILLLLRIKEHVCLSRLFGADRLNQDDIETYEGMYRKILKEAGDKAESDKTAEMPVEARRMIKRLTEYEQETLLFMLDFNVPFTNNLAERSLRMPKAKQKISGGFRSKRGADAFARIRGYISTVKKRSKNVLDSLTAAFNGQALEFLSDAPVQS